MIRSVPRSTSRLLGACASRTLVALFLSLVLASILLAAPAAAAEHRLGVGAHFWKTVDDLADDRFDGIEDDGWAWVVSYKIEPRGLIHFQFDAEIYTDGYAGSEDFAVSPIAFVGIGGSIYGAVGAGVVISNGLSDNVSEPFFAGRIGWEIDLLPGISVDIHANYYADAFEELEDASTDTITLGGLVRFSL